ncbi:hypothetical protein PWG14_20900 (plasmid) [Chromobacterium amazonense]|uniref:hypothetical protein n=1 Tax=Chromobacterium amazonense TaxID=1382803 RepID=UPI00237ED4C0|nr:hypothetical protein [Chromobacterium amazonense]MDE1714951.1 hypothetical protein [Chromobacterium amazonense]
MSDVIRYAPVARHARALAVLNTLDSASKPAKLLLYGGTPPPDFAPVAGALVEIVLSKPSGTINDASELVLAGATEGMVAAAGRVSWARLVSGDGQPVADMDVGLPGSGAAVELPIVDLQPGALVRLSGAKLLEP